VQSGDILTAIGNDVISADLPYLNALMRHAVNETTTLTVWREGQTLTLGVTLQALPH